MKFFEITRAPDEAVAAARPRLDSTALLSLRIAELEDVVADYVQRYGLSDLARKTMVNSPADTRR